MLLALVDDERKNADNGIEHVNQCRRLAADAEFVKKKSTLYARHDQQPTVNVIMTRTGTSQD